MRLELLSNLGRAKCPQWHLKKRKGMKENSNAMLSAYRERKTGRRSATGLRESRELFKDKRHLKQDH